VIVQQEQETDLADAAGRGDSTAARIVPAHWCCACGCPGGSGRPGRAAAVCRMFDEDGEFVGYRGATVDISAQKQTDASQESRGAAARLRPGAWRPKVEAKVEERTRDSGRGEPAQLAVLANFDQPDLPAQPQPAVRASCARACSRRGGGGGCWRILLVDLDGFKAGERQLSGHDAGDELLRQQVAEFACSSCVRATDTAARLGGDEFTVVLPDLEHAGGGERRWRGRVIDRLAEPVLPHLGRADRYGDGQRRDRRVPAGTRRPVWIWR
jgi:hypothetical protein